MENQQPKILKVGQEFSFQLPLKVLRAFAYENDSVYYIVAQLKKNTPIGHHGGVVWGVLKIDGTFDQIPVEAIQRAEQLIVKENLLKDLE